METLAASCLYPAVVGSVAFVVAVVVAVVVIVAVAADCSQRPAPSPDLPRFPPLFAFTFYRSVSVYIDDITLERRATRAIYSTIRREHDERLELDVTTTVTKSRVNS